MFVWNLYKKLRQLLLNVENIVFLLIAEFYRRKLFAIVKVIHNFDIIFAVFYFPLALKFLLFLNVDRLTECLWIKSFDLRSFYFGEIS